MGRRLATIPNQRNPTVISKLLRRYFIPRNHCKYCWESGKLLCEIYWAHLWFFTVDDLTFSCISATLPSENDRAVYKQQQWRIHAPAHGSSSCFLLAFWPASPCSAIDKYYLVTAAGESCPRCVLHCDALPACRRADGNGAAQWKAGFRDAVCHAVAVAPQGLIFFLSGLFFSTCRARCAWCWTRAS
jgi:hypothetical protein